MHNENARSRRKTGPVPIGVAKRLWDSYSILRNIGCGDSLLSQDLGADRFVGPIDVGLRIALFGDEPVHCSGAFGFLGVVNRPHLDSRLLLEIPEDGF